MLLRKKLTVLVGTALMMGMMLALASPAFAGINPNCTFNPDGSIEQCAGGSGGGGDSIGSGSGGQCTVVYDAATNTSTEECTPGVLGY